jgi:hypothetical protein
MDLFRRPSNSARSVRPLSLEELEPREVPAAQVTATIFGGTLTVAGVDKIFAAANSGLNNQEVSVTGAGAGAVDVSVLPGTTFKGTALVTLHFTRVNSISFNMGLGDDVVSVSNVTGFSPFFTFAGAVNAISFDMGLGNDSVSMSNVTGFNRITAFGGAGDDVIQVASGPLVTSEIYGGPGNDVLSGGSGPNILDGGDGNDQLFGGSGRDLLVGGFGFDTLNGGDGDDIEIGGLFMQAQSNLSARRVALNTALTHWNAAGSYAARVATTYADLLVRVAPDNSQDVMEGGLGQDWFLGRLSGQGSDPFVGRTADELINLNFPLPSF